MFNEDLIEQFSQVAGVDEERAEWYLDRANWDIEMALASFFEDVENSSPANKVESTPKQDPEESAAKEPTSDSSSKGQSQKSTVHSIFDLRNRDSSPDEEEGQAFYAGGSEQSGQQVLGPGKKKDIINDVFKSCQEQSILNERKPAGQRPTTFSGTGYKLGQTSGDTEVVSASSSQSTNLVTLKLWRSGFTVNDQEIRSYDDPTNQEFLDAIKRGDLPAEIRKDIQGAEVHLDIEDHRHEDCAPTKSKVKAFTGKGHMLGSPSPATVGMTIPTDPADQAANETAAKKQLNLDSSKPITTLQIRLADETTVRVEFNLDHTIEDIRRYIVTMRPQYATRSFNLLTTYPSKVLGDREKTIEQENLQDSTIMQRLT